MRNDDGSLGLVSSLFLAACDEQQDADQIVLCSLICASVGCGRYKSGHAQQHFTDTGHLYSLELETQRVWDYAGDGYVHRLIQNKADGKLVELPSASSTGKEATYAGKASGSGGSGEYGGTVAKGEMVSSEKIESIGLEYSYLLTSQLESQRFYYEDKIHGLQKKLDDMVDRKEQQVGAAKVAEADMASLRKEVADSVARGKVLEMDRARSEKRAEKAIELARKLQRDLQAEQAVSHGLMKRVELLNESETATKAKMQDLEEQMRDLMFFVSAREKIGQESELTGGDVEVAPKAPGKKKKGGK